MAWLTVGEENGSPVQLHYDDYGEGRPVVLVHGWPLGSRGWEHQLPPLVEAGYRVVVYDRRGSGRSTQPWRGYEYDTLAADLHALVSGLGLEDVTLVGASLGAGQVSRFVRTHGAERLRRLVFISAPPPYLYRCYDNPDGRFDDADIDRMESALRRDRVAFLDRLLRTAFHTPQRDNTISHAQHAYHLSAVTGDSPKGTLDLLRAAIQTDFRADLADVGTPCLSIHGGDDAIVPSRPPPAVAGGRRVVVPGAPHALNITHPTVVNRALLAFLND